MKFTVTPAFTRETEQQPAGKAISPEKYRRCMRLRIESIKWFLVNLGFIFFSNFMFSHQIWKKSSIWLVLIYGWRNPKILTHSVVCFFTSPLTFIEKNLTKEKTHTTSCSFVSVQFEKRNIYIYIYLCIQENVSVMSKTRPTNFKSSVSIRFPKKQKIAIMRMTHWSLLRK